MSNKYFEELDKAIETNKVCGNGYWRFRSPKELVSLVEPMGPFDNPVVPVAVSVFGEILALENDEDGLYVDYIDPLTDEITPICFGIDFLFQDLDDVEFLNEKFRNKLFLEVREKLGEVNANQCYGFVPMLKMGGSEKVENLEICDLEVHLTLLTQM